MADRLGQQLGIYHITHLLGRGGFAEVYLGQHVRLNQQAAIKVLHAHLTEQEAEHFQQEAQTIAMLVHPGIVRVFDYDVQDGVPFLVIDYAPNGTLRCRYPKGSLVPLSVIVTVVKQVADALQYAHEQKFIHRDVKPENMLLGRREEVLLSDPPVLGGWLFCPAACAPFQCDGSRPDPQVARQPEPASHVRSFPVE